MGRPGPLDFRGFQQREDMIWWVYVAIGEHMETGSEARALVQ